MCVFLLAARKISTKILQWETAGRSTWFAGKTDDAEPRITRMGFGKVGEREIWLKQKKQLH